MMIRQFTTLTATLSTALLLSACGNAQVPAVYRTQPTSVRAQAATPVSNQLIVRFRKNVTRMDLLNFNQKYSLQTLSYLPELDAYVMQVRTPISSQAMTTMIGRMQQEPVAALVEYNHPVQATPVYDVSIMPVFKQ